MIIHNYMWQGIEELKAKKVITIGDSCGTHGTIFPSDIYTYDRKLGSKWGNYWNVACAHQGKVWQILLKKKLLCHSQLLFLVRSPPIYIALSKTQFFPAVLPLPCIPPSCKYVTYSIGAHMSISKFALMLSYQLLFAQRNVLSGPLMSTRNWQWKYL